MVRSRATHLEKLLDHPGKAIHGHTSEPRGAMQIEEVERTFDCTVPNAGAGRDASCGFGTDGSKSKSAQVVSIGLSTMRGDSVPGTAATARNGCSGKPRKRAPVGDACFYVGRRVRKVEPRRVVGTDNLFEFATRTRVVHGQGVGFDRADLTFQDSRCRNYSAAGLRGRKVIRPNLIRAVWGGATCQRASMAVKAKDPTIGEAHWCAIDIAQCTGWPWLGNHERREHSGF